MQKVFGTRVKVQRHTCMSPGQPSRSRMDRNATPPPGVPPGVWKEPPSGAGVCCLLAPLQGALYAGAPWPTISPVVCLIFSII